MGEWISVEEKLPEKNQLCITSYKPVIGRVHTLPRHYEIGRGLTSFGSRVADLWSPLTEPPK